MGQYEMDFNPLRVLVACEFSGTVRRAFSALGHDAWSCDLLPSDDRSNKHIVGDARDILNDGWDLLMVAHPPCTVRLEQTYADTKESLRLVSMDELTGSHFSLFSRKDDWIWTWAYSEAMREGIGYKGAQDNFFLETERDYEVSA